MLATESAKHLVLTKGQNTFVKEVESNSRNYKATENFGKLSGDCDMQGHRSAGPSEV